jgi:HEAT repeat protein
MKSSKIELIVATIAGFVIGGCAAPRPRDDSLDAADARQKVLKTLPPAPRPPEVPPKSEVALDPEVRQKAKEQIITTSRSNDPILRANAMEAAQMALGATDAAPVVLRGLKDDKPIVRFAAAMAAGSLKLEPARPLLHALADDANEMVRIGARFALHKLGDFRRSHELEVTAVSTEPRIRATTAMALGLLGEKSALKVLRPMQKDIDPIVRLQVAEAMWRLGDEIGLETLVSASVSQFPDDQIIAVQGLAGPRDARVRPHVQGKLTTMYDEVNLVAARAMGMIGSDEGYGVAVKGAKSNDPRQRHLAALALGEIGRSDAQPILANLLDDKEPAVRLAAATAVLQLKQ